jgi:hypothetical protein
VRGVLLVLLALGVLELLILPEIAALLIAMLVMLVSLLLAAAKLAIDLVDLERADLIADGLLVVVLGFACTQTAGGDRLIDAGLLALALATQVVALALGRRRRAALAVAHPD